MISSKFCFVVCMFMIKLVSAGICPIHCDCHSSWLRGVTNVVVDCSKQSLTAVPDRRVPRGITSFVLNENVITELPKNTFIKYRYLRELYLYKNFLTYIDKDAFVGLSRLKELSLHSNRLTSIENGTFAPLRNLRKLYLFSNFLKEISPGVFSGLKRVETVFLHENLLRYITKDTFLPLERLKVLTLYRNYLKVLQSGSLNGLVSMTKMYIHQNKIQKIERGTFQECSNLLVLQLSNNRLTNLTTGMFFGLEKLSEIYFDNNHIKEIAEVFEHVPKLRKLVLIGNKIQNIHPGSFVKLRNLGILSLAGNLLSQLHSGVFVGLSSLKQLFLQDNNLVWVEPLCFVGLRNLHQLYMFRNKIFYIQANTFHGLNFLSELNLGVNNITGLANNAFLGLSHLLVLQLNSNRLVSIPQGAFNGLPKLHRLVTYFNRIRFVADNAFSSFQRIQSIVWYPPLALVRSSKKLRLLQSNNLQCDCNLKWLKSWLNKANLASPIHCHQPVYLRGQNVTDVDDDAFKCDAMRVSISPRTAMVNKGASHIVHCETNVGANFTWFKNGSLLSSSRSHFQTTSGILILRDIALHSGGQYTCLAISSSGLASISTEVTFGVPPKMISPLVETVIITYRKGPIMLACESEGFPVPLYIWYLNDIPITDGNDSRFFGYDGRLILAKLSVRDIGVYKCEAHNELGMAKRIVVLKISNPHTLEVDDCVPRCTHGCSCKQTYACHCPAQLQQKCRPECYRNNTVGSGDDFSSNQTDDDDDDDDFNFQVAGLTKEEVDELRKSNVTTCKDVVSRSYLESMQLTNSKHLLHAASKVIAPKTFTVTEMYERQEQRFVSTSLNELDTILLGGLPKGTITEVYGPPGSGKTQFSMMVSLAAAINENSCVVYIDTENAFSAKRLLEIKKHSFPTCDDVLASSVLVFLESDLNSLQERIESLEEIIIERNVSLIVLDSIASLVRKQLGDRNLINDRNKTLLKLAASLKYFADSFNLAVLVTNQIAAKAGYYGDECIIPALGNTWSHAVNTRLSLTYLNDNSRKLKITKSPISRQSEFSFTITTDGIVLDSSVKGLETNL